ncbi:alkaline phosphatase family protein [Pendulispora rubella]|uniref:Alkaline phosphatase family protein n=1 Tax=Pendulispora rubella TaxID=2741070 RepID=A0ABZ2L1N9_9BACT
MAPRQWTLALARFLTPAVLACACGPGAKSPPPTGSETRTTQSNGPSHRVVVSFVVDQFAAWIAAERLPLLPENGGFARLRREGTWVQRLRYAHAVTDTAPGHAALYTGAMPRDSGIFGNEVPDADGKRVTILLDPNVNAIGSEGPGKSPSSSIARLRVETVADAFRAANPNALIVSISLKDRGAIFAGGRRPTATLWYDSGTDRMVTSTAFAQSFPAWAAKGSSTEAMKAIRAPRWDLLDAEFTRTHAAGPDAQPGEGDAPGFGTTFPHEPSQAKAPAAGIRLSPNTDQALLDLGLAALDAENAKSRDTLLAISLSTPDYIGHVFGPDSWEAWDELQRIDRALAGFFSELDQRFGADGYAVMLAADHGGISLPELPTEARSWCKPGAPPDRFERPCKAGERLLPDDITRELLTATQQALGEGGWIQGVADPYVFLTAKGRQLLAAPTPSTSPGAPASAADSVAKVRARADKLRDTIRKTLLRHPGVLSVRESSELRRNGGSDAIDELVVNSIPPESGEFYVVPRAGSFFDPSQVVGYGSSHGTPYLYDRMVPMLVRAPKRVPAGVVKEEPVLFGAYARTLADLLGAPPPSAATKAPSLVKGP